VRQVARVRSRFLTGTALAVASVLATAVPALAHTAVELDSTDVVPTVAPLIVDGESPVALFGTLPKKNAVRSAQLHLTAGQTLKVGLAIPDQAPENTLTTAQLPRVVVVTPDYKVTEIKPTMRVPIATEDGLKLLLIGSYAAPATVTGDYSLIAVGQAPERFALSTGIEGKPFGGVLRGVVATDEDMDEWYATPPA